jgi:hypothetical protein
VRETNFKKLQDFLIVLDPFDSRFSISEAPIQSKPGSNQLQTDHNKTPTKTFNKTKQSK